LPTCLVAIINKSLAKQNEDRFASGAEMAEALRPVRIQPAKAKNDKSSAHPRAADEAG